MSEFVTLVNRTSKPLNALWDGKSYPIAPGKHSLPRLVAEAAKRQNPLMGSGDPDNQNIDGSLRMEPLLGIEEDGDDCSPVEQSASIERWDRRKLPKSAQNVEVVAGKNGIFSPRDVQSPQPANLAFVKP